MINPEENILPIPHFPNNLCLGQLSSFKNIIPNNKPTWNVFIFKQELDRLSSKVLIYKYISPFPHTIENVSDLFG